MADHERARPYRGPVLLLTLDEGERALHALDHCDDPLARSITEKVRAALESDPHWRRPTA